MKISIITAGFRPDGVAKTCRGIDDQTYKEWEHIIVNDCNPLLTEVMKNECAKNPNRHWIDLGMRTGFYGGIARNIGVMAAFTYWSETARKKDPDWWIAFHDDDNEWYPDYLETMIIAKNEHPDAVLIGGDIEIRGKINKDYKHVMKCKLYPQNNDLGCWIYRRDMFFKYGFLPASDRYKITYDYEFIKRIMEGEGSSKIFIIEGPPKFIFYHKER